MDGCCGVAAAVRNERVGRADNWLRHIRGVRSKHEARAAAIADAQQCIDRLCELSVIEQVANVCQTNVVRDAWYRGQELAVHGWVYGLRDGPVRDPGATATNPAEVSVAHQAALSAL